MTGWFFARAYEFTHKGTAFDSTMALYNNEIGSTVIHRKLLVLPDFDAIKADLLKKYDAGELWIWDGPGTSKQSNGQIIKSNGVKIFPSEEIIP